MKNDVFLQSLTHSQLNKKGPACAGSIPSAADEAAAEKGFMASRLSAYQGLPIVISAPSGAGKSTLAQRVVKNNPSTALSISCTTRSPRNGEVNGEHYIFTTVDQFKQKIEKGEFLEWAVVHGHYYGTPIAALKSQLEKGVDVVLTIDPQGALALQRIYPQGVFIFVVPPSWEVLSERLKARATDDRQTLEIRIANARKELSYLSHYNYLVVNDDLDAAVGDIEAIIRAEHRRLTHVNKNDIPILRLEY